MAEPSAASQSAYTARGLTFRYRPAAPPAVAEISFRLPAGQATAILGPNGAGKSTLLHLLLGVLRPQTGDLRLFGRPLSAYGPAERSRLISLVPQREHMPFAFRVHEYLLLGRTPYLSLLAQPSAADAAKAHAVLAQLNLQHLAEREVASLSGGEHQLVLIARALVQDTPVLLLDEPLAHLDLGNRQRVLAILRRLVAQGRTVVFTTHDPQAAGQVAQQVLLLRGGHLIFAGPAAAALTAERLSALYGVPLRVRRVDGEVVVLEAPPSEGPRPS